MILSILIVSWNTRDLLRRCLTSIRRQARDFDADTMEAILVDNASTDGSADMARTEFPATHLIQNSTNVGFARANNQAIQVSQGAFVLLLNPDTEPQPGALRRLVDFLRAEPRAGAAGACLLNPDGSLQASAYPMPRLASEFWRMMRLDSILPRSSYPLERWASFPPRQVDVAVGASLLVRRSALDDVGLLDDEYFMYTEEVDLCYRLARAGWKVYWVPQARVLHYGGQSTRLVADEMFLRLYESKIRFFRKHYGRRAAFFYKVLLTGASLPRIALGSLRPPAGGEAISSSYWRLVKALPRF